MGPKTASYREAVRYLYALQKFGIKFGLSKTTHLLESFGNPHEGQHYIHIAGTNGKGSVAVLLEGILREAGYRVGLYTSPHLVRFTERFRINGEEIPQAQAAKLIGELQKVIVPEEPPTFFEATTAMALAYFAQEGTDLAIMEVGLGGRLDATNVITPLVSVITNISVEHEMYLGSTLHAITREKAGVIKPGIDVVTGATQSSVLAQVAATCQRMRAPLVRVGKEVRYRRTPSGMDYWGLRHRFKDLQLGLMGRFQCRNAAMALGAMELLEEKGWDVSEAHVRGGLREANWPGRMQIVSRAPLIVLDGAHNPAAMGTLRKTLTSELSYNRLILVVGVMEDKAIGRILGKIVPWTDYVIYTRPTYPRAADPKRLLEKGAAFQKPGHVESSMQRALDRAQSMANPDDLIVVSGSLFTVGEALTYFAPDAQRPDGP
jgi:dihydrofolate synthase/folylpolyglutamate synthase